MKQNNKSDISNGIVTNNNDIVVAHVSINGLEQWKTDFQINSRNLWINAME